MIRLFDGENVDGMFRCFLPIRDCHSRADRRTELLHKYCACNECTMNKYGRETITAAE